jgi:hypothetical protein
MRSFTHPHHKEVIMKRSFNNQIPYQLDCIGSRVMGWFNLARWCSCSRLLAFSLLLLMLHEGGVAQVSPYWRTFLHGNWTDPIWEKWDATGDTLMESPVGPNPDGHSQIRTNVYVSSLVISSGTLEVMYWAGGLHVSGTFRNTGTIKFWSRNDMETTGPGVIYNENTIEMHPEGGYGPIISGKLYNSGTIRTNSGGYYGMGNLFQNTGTLDIEPGTELNVGSTGTALGGTINVEAGGLFSFTGSGIVELSTSFSGSGEVALGEYISVAGTGNVTIGNPLRIRTKLGTGTITVTTALNDLSSLAEGTVEIGAGCSAGGIGSIGGTLINHGSVYIGYGVPQGSGLFYNSGQIIWDYDYNQYSSVNFENHGTFRKRGTGGAILTGNFEHCVDSAFNIHVQSGWLQLYNPAPCTTPINSLTSNGGTIRIDSGAAFIVPSFDFSGDTVDNKGTITSNPFRFVRSDPPQVLTGGGTISNLVLNGGNVQLLGPQAISNLTLASGLLQLYDSDLILGSAGLSGASDSSYVVTNGVGRLVRNVGTSFVSFPVGTSTSYNPVTVKTGTGTESFAVNVAEGIAPSILNPSNAVQRTWGISEGTPGGNGTITFTTQWNSGEEGSALDRDTIEGWRSGGGPWIMQLGSLIDVTPTGYPAVATIASNSLSSWTVANSHITASVPFTGGWNIISNPVTREPGTDSVTHLFPTASSNYAYSFEPGSGYQQRFTMANGKGYWEKFAALDTSHIDGFPRSLDSISVLAGWNLVGSISYSVDTAMISSDPPGIRASLWYSYAGGYAASSALLPGQGYWIKSSAAGKFILNAAASALSRPKEPKQKDNPLLADEFILTEKSGAKQSLYIEAESSQAGAMSELPPQGPEGTFDARFASQKSIESANSSAGQTIVIHSSSYPVTFTWNLKDDGGYVITDGVTGRLMEPKHTSGKGELVIRDPAITRLVLVKEQGVPHEFVLDQNYPNPFNPTTQIKFSVAVTGPATVEMFDILGQKVKTLFNENAEPGRFYNLRVDGANIASGVYFYRLQSGAKLDTRKMVLLK